MDGETQQIVEAIDSEDARQILALASLESMSAHDLEEELEVSLTTVYRYTDELVDLDLLTEETEIDPSGTQYSTFQTAIRRIAFTIHRGEFRVDLQYRDDMVDRFSRLWRALGDQPS